MHTILNKIAKGLLGLSLLAAFQAQAFDADIDYKVLSKAQPTESGDKIEVLELFWYGCPHCYQIEPGVDRWKAQQPDYVEFRRMPAVLGSSWTNHARAYFALEMMGVLDKVHEPLFKALHTDKKRVFDDESITDFVVQQGVDRGEFLKAYKSFVVDMKVRRSSQLTRRMGIDGVPSFVVNGKYVTSPSLTGGSQRMFQLLDHLVAIEAGVIKPEDAEEVAENAGQ